jgi:hypothetical protein
MSEQWRAIAEWPGYEVSDLGRVRSVARVIERSNGSRQTVQPRILKLTWDLPGDSGHLTVTVYRKRKKVRRQRTCSQCESIRSKSKNQNNNRETAA